MLQKPPEIAVLGSKFEAVTVVSKLEWIIELNNIDGLLLPAQLFYASNYRVVKLILKFN